MQSFKLEDNKTRPVARYFLQKKTNLINLKNKKYMG